MEKLLRYADFAQDIMVMGMKSLVVDNEVEQFDFFDVYAGIGQELFQWHITIDRCCFIYTIEENWH